MKPSHLAALISLAALPAVADEIDFDAVPEIVVGQDAGRWYLRADAGYGTDGAFGGAGVGYRFLPWLRGDLTVERLPAEQDCGGCTDRGTAAVHAAFASLYYDLGTVAGFTPYAGAGLGLAHIGGDDGAMAGRSETGAAAALAAGIAWEAASGFAVDLGYRFLYLGGIADSPSQHQFRIGIRVALP